MTKAAEAAAPAATDTPETTEESNQLGEGVEAGPQVAAEHSYGAQYDTRITLSRPIKRPSAELAEVTAIYLREPTAGDLSGIRLSQLAQFDAGELATLLPRIAMPRLAPAEIKAMGLRDMLAVGNGVARFLF